MTIKKSTFKRIIVVALILGLLAIVSVGTVLATASVTIWTPPIETARELTIDGTYVGAFPVYNGASNITFTWDAFTFPDGVNGSYKVSVWQNTTPLADTPTWHELHTSHHWASDPNPTTFTMGPFLVSENLCNTCPSMIVVQPETFTAYLDEFGTTQYAYAPIAEALTLGPLALTDSDEFLIDGVVSSNDHTSKACVPTQSLTCGCEGPDKVCRNSCGVEVSRDILGCF